MLNCKCEKLPLHKFFLSSTLVIFNDLLIKSILINIYWSLLQYLKAFCKHVLMCDVATIHLSTVIIGALQDPIGQTQGLRAESGPSYYFIWAISTEFA